MIHRDASLRGENGVRQRSTACRGDGTTMTLRLRTLTGALMAAVLLAGCSGIKERGHSTFSGRPGPSLCEGKGLGRFIWFVSFISFISCPTQTNETNQMNQISATRRWTVHLVRMSVLSILSQPTGRISQSK